MKYLTKIHEIDTSLSVKFEKINVVRSSRFASGSVFMRHRVNEMIWKIS